jgi:Ca2+-binding EF-hand superfamily protein
MKAAWILAALLAPVTLTAHEPGREARHHFDDVDADRDGSISRAEADAKAPGLASSFDAMDTDKNGGLSRAELEQFAHRRHDEMHDRMEEKFKSADVNGDGQLSADEAKGMPRIANDFAAIDANGDGLVSRDELRARGKAMRKEHMDEAHRERSEDKPQ